MNELEKDEYGRMTEDGYEYFSKSKNTYIPVSEMNEVHIKNAVINILQNWINYLKGVDIDEFLNTSKDVSMFALSYSELISELQKRQNAKNKEIENG